MISVIIPCFNSEEYIARAIDSVLHQTYKDYEIILVNNNSSDNTNYILNNYFRERPDIIRVFDEYKKGAPAARNKGLYESKGEWIQFLDSDDELLPEKFAQQIALINKSSVNVIIGNCYIQKTIKGTTEKKIRDIETKDVWKGLLTSKLGITSANLWKREAIVAAGGWNEAKSSSQEYNLLFRILKNNSNINFSLLPLTIVHARENSVHKSADKNRLIDILGNNVQLRLEIKEYLKSKNLLTKQLRYIADTYIYTYLVNTTGVSFLSLKKGILPDFVKKTLRESDLRLPIGFLGRFHINRVLQKVKNRL